MFVNHLWKDAQPSPVAINVREISHITESHDDQLGTHVMVYLKNKDCIPIEGDIIEILGAFQKHLTNMY